MQDLVNYILTKENAIVDIVKVIRPCQPLVKPKKKDFTEDALGTKGMVAATLEISKNGDLNKKYKSCQGFQNK